MSPGPEVQEGQIDPGSGILGDAGKSAGVPWLLQGQKAREQGLGLEAQQEDLQMRVHNHQQKKM